ncbi:MAG: DUF2271 domain-containing protein [Clostridiales Family XIII bacterium]|nr:DUF2271 domain-containing protein [Clostridiales Family XIII bacterium]
MKTRVFPAICLFLLIAAAAACVAMADGPSLSGAGVSGGAGSDGRIVISFDYEKQSGIASNQFAVWIEDENGRHVKTLYATAFTANGGYERRPDSIPTWVSKSGLASMTKEQVDAISSATPASGRLSYTWDLTDADGETVTADVKYKFFVEGNLRWKNRVLYSGLIDLGNMPAGLDPIVEYNYEVSEGQLALTASSREHNMIRSLVAEFYFDSSGESSLFSSVRGEIDNVVREELIKSKIPVAAIAVLRGGQTEYLYYSSGGFVPDSAGPAGAGSAPGGTGSPSAGAGEGGVAGGAPDAGVASGEDGAGAGEGTAQGGVAGSAGSSEGASGIGSADSGEGASGIGSADSGEGASGAGGARQSSLSKNSLFQIGALSDTYTAFGILLIERYGWLSLDDPVSKHLPRFVAFYEGGQVPPESLTVANLLYHTSGISDGAAAGLHIAGRPSQAGPRGGRVDLDFYPSSGYAYAHMNYSLLGQIIEAASNQSYEEFMAAEVLSPLGLENTYVDAQKALRTGRTVEGSRLSFTRARPYSPPAYDSGSPAGHMLSDAQDMARWLQIQMGEVEIPDQFLEIVEKSHQIYAGGAAGGATSGLGATSGRSTAPGLAAASSAGAAPADGATASAASGAAIVDATTSASPSGPPPGGIYSAGWSIDPESGALSHTGYTPDYSAVASIRPRSGTAVCILANMNAPANIGNMAENILNILEGKPPYAYTADIWRLVDMVFSILAGIGAAGTVLLLFLAFRRIRLLLQIGESRRDQRKWKPLRLGPLVLPLLLILIVAASIFIIPATLGTSAAALSLWAPGSVFSGYAAVGCLSVCLAAYKAFL